jgi:hypothetical protein
MNQSKEVVLHFLGGRTYLQGTTLFDGLRSHCRQGRNISFRISRLVESDRVSAERIDVDSEDTSRFSALLVWDEGGARRGLGIVPLPPSPTPLRLPFDEAAIVGRAEFTADSATTSFQGSETLARSLVALNKALLLRLLQPSGPGQWLFVRLDLDKYYDKFGALRLTLRSNLAFAAVSSSIEIDGHAAGTVVFSWRKK